MNTLIISALILFVINVCNGLLVLPFNNVPKSIAAGDKIGIPISNDKFIISNCAALGNSYLYTEDNKVTEYTPVAYFRDGTTLELYIPDVGKNTSKKYFVVVELPLAEAIIKTDPFTVTPGSKIDLPKTDGCGKTVKFSNKEISNADEKDNGNKPIEAKDDSKLSGNNNENSLGIDANKVNNDGNKNNNSTDTNGKSTILNAENTTKDTTENEEGGSKNVVIIAAGTSVVALVVISGLVFMRGRSYMKTSDSEISYSSLNYVSPKPYNPVGSLYDNLTNNNDEFDRDYQLRCLQSDNHSQVSYPVSLSDGSCVNMDKNTDIFEAADDIPVPEIPKDIPRDLPMNQPNDLEITKHVVEEIVINPEKVMSETANAASATVTTASVALAINECGNLTIENSMANQSSIEKSNTTTSSSSSCSTCSSCSCSTCSSCSCSCSHSGNCSCSCSCNDSSRYTTTTNNESSLKLLSLSLNNAKPFTSIDFSNNSAMGDTTRGYSVFADQGNNNKDSVALTTITETTGIDDSRRDTQYTDYTVDSRRDTQFTEATGIDDSRRDTQYTDYTVDSRRDTQYTDYTVDSRRDTQYTDYTVDSRRDTQYTDYTVDSRRDTQYTDYTVDSRRDTQYTEDSRRDTQYTDYTEGTSYTTDRDSRRYTDYTEGSSYTNRDSRYSEYTEGSSYSSCSCSDSECDCSRRNTQYSEYTSGEYTSEYTSGFTSGYTSYTTDSRRQTATTDFSSSQYSSQYSSDFCEAHDATESESSRILPLSTIEPFGGSANTSSFLDALQSKQNVIRESICGLLPTGPITGKPPKFDIEFVAQNDLETDKPGELKIKKMDVIRILENLEGGYYMANNSTSGDSGKIPAFKILSLL